MKNRFAFILGILVLGASVMAGAQVSEEIPGLEQGQAQPQEQEQGPAQPQGQEQAQSEPSSSVARISLTHGLKYSLTPPTFCGWVTARWPASPASPATRSRCSSTVD